MEPQGRNKAFIDVRLRPGIARRQKRTEQRPQGIRAQNFVKIGPADPEICSHTDRHTQTQTHKLIAILRSPPGAE